MRSKALLSLLVLVSAVGGAVAQTSSSSGNPTTLTFADDGDHVVWVQHGAIAAPGADRIQTQKSSAEIPLTGKADDDVICVQSLKTGNLATVPVGKVRKDGTYTIAADAYRLLGHVKVHLDHQGQPVAAANITLDDGAHSISQLLDPSSKGDVDFYGVKPGSLKVKAVYKTKAGQEKSVTQILDAPLTHPDPTPSLTISVPEDVAVVTDGAAPAPSPAPSSATAGATGNPSSPAAPAEKPINPLGSILAYLLGLALIGVIAFVGYRYATQNKDLVQEKLQQLGVDIPKPGDDPTTLDPASIPAPKKPEPPQKIILSDAAPDPIAPMVASTVVSTGQPRLVSESGDAMTLTEGETIVGRDVGLGLSLVGESTVSRRHAQIVRNGNDVSLTDLGSTNGTYVNGAQLKAATHLRPGDTVQFGSVRFRYEGS